MKLIIILLSVLVYMNANATNRVQEIQALNPNATPYEVLVKAYSEASDKIAITDIDSNNQDCVLVYSINADLLSTKLQRYKSVKEEISHF